MAARKKVLGILGNIRTDSSNERLLRYIGAINAHAIDLHIFKQLADIPHFNPEHDNESVPAVVTDFRKLITDADGVIICTPEYVFSIPGSLKNALEWVVSTTVFTDKPLGLITASASGQKGHEQLQLIMQTLGGKFSHDTLLLISGIKGKIGADGAITDAETDLQIRQFSENFLKNMNEMPQ
ncbi:NADPH-dependent FMN reductase [Emticicia sp. 17c]|uniref:NADPH-dependent FMN reductase n=1 Tax=Emticicia sp. 17c TaxID=3127704 RepID=UPI00301C11AC